MTVVRLLPKQLHWDAPSGGTFASVVKSGQRLYLSGASACRDDGSVSALGDASGQTHAAIDAIERVLAAAGGSLRDVTRLTTCIVDRDHRKAVYDVIGARLKGVFPVSTGLVVAGLPRAELMVQIIAEAMLGGGIQRLRTFEIKDWFGQPITWQGAMVAATAGEIFVRGQTGSHLDGKSMAGPGRTPADAGAQAELALSNLGVLLGEAGSGLDDVAKITVHISDRAYRYAVYPAIGKAFRGIHPVSTGLIVPGFARPEILFEIDAEVHRKADGKPHRRLRPYHSRQARYGTQQQPLDCDFCMAVVVGDTVTLRGQTGIGLDHIMRGHGNAAAQARHAMQNVSVLLDEAGATVADVVKAAVFVTDREFLPGVAGEVLAALDGTLPALSAIIVKGLASPELLMEVDITAVVRRA